MTPHETQSSQFGLVSSIRQPQSDMVLIAEPTALFAPEARKGRLYLLTEVHREAARGRDACELIIRTIRKTFYQDSSYSVTSSLRKAISAANHALYQHNFSASPHKRAVVGVTCAVVKDNDLYIAQVTPAQAYLSAEGKLRALPTNSAWTGGASGAAVLVKPGALGSSLTVEPEFYRAVLRPGDALLLCTSNLTPLLNREAVAQMLRTPEAADAVDALVELCKRSELTEAHGLAIRINPPLSRAAQAAPLSRAGVGERGLRAMRAVGDQIAHMTGEVVLLVKGPLARRQRRQIASRREHEQRATAGLTQMPEEPPPPPTPAVPALDLGETLDERVAHERQERRAPFGALPRPHGDDPLPPSAFLGEGNYAATPPVSERIDLSDTPSMAMLGSHNRRGEADLSLPLDLTVGERVAQVFDRLTDPISGVGRRRRRGTPPRALPTARRQAGGLSYRREKPPFPWLQLLLLIAVVSLAYVYGRGLLNQNAQDEALKSLTDAESAVAAIRAAPDEATAAQRLDAAAVALNAVRASSIVTATADNVLRLESIQREYERAQAAIQKLTYFDDLAVIGQHPQAAARSTFSTLIVPPPLTGITNTEGFSSIYALDSSQGVLYRMPKSGGPVEPFLSPNDAIDSLPVGKVRAIAWRIDNVVAIGQTDSGAASYYFRENGQWKRSFLANSEEWTSTEKALRLTTYDGNLYLWGASDGQILKYFSGRTSDPYDPWIKDDDSVRKVVAATDLAIDGDVYLLMSDGRVEIFSANVFKREIVPPAIKPPLTITTKFFVTGGPDSGSIFLLDTNKNTERVIQFDKQTGAFIQQMTVHASGPLKLDTLSAIAVDDKSGQQPVMYLVNGSQIMRATLPSAPKPFREGPTAAPTTP